MNTHKKKMPVKKQGKPSGKIDTIEKLATLVAQGFADIHDRFDDVYAQLSAIRSRLDTIEARLDALETRLYSVELESRSMRTEMKALHVRLESIEEKVGMQSGYAKEIDYLLERVTRIEKHLHLS